MNQKEYELIAEHFKAELEYYNVEDFGSDELEPYEITKSSALQLADTLQSNYDNFNRTKFLTACGIEETK